MPAWPCRGFCVKSFGSRNLEPNRYKGVIEILERFSKAQGVSVSSAFALGRLSVEFPFFWRHRLAIRERGLIFCPVAKLDAFVAQLVEQLTLNQLVRSSNLREGTIFSSSVLCGAAA